tara:strand:- start:954 stop:1463 length:510 start_codon:yes stop_codon:yes gene_type:complete
MKARQAILFAIFLIAFSNLYSQTRRDRKKADKNTLNWKYEIKCEKTGRQGTYFVKVTSYLRKVELALEQSKKNAVHGVLFTGLSEGKCRENPLIKDPGLYEKEISFFKDFFSKYGDYSKYCTASSGMAENILKINKKEFSVDMKISVNKKQLKLDFEKLGLIKSLDSGF